MASSSSALASSFLSPDIGQEIRQEAKYQPGQADTDFARRFGHLAGAKVRTVGEAFAQFTQELGYTVNPLYKNMITDLVGTTHLITVNARFQRDSLWCLGLVTTLDLLLKNYPEGDEMREAIVQALLTSTGMNVKDVRAEAAALEFWAKDKTRADIEAALVGEQDNASSPLSKIAQPPKSDDYWMYSRYFGIGLLKVMDLVGVEMDKDEVYPVMEDWMSNKLGKSHLTACVSASEKLFVC